MKIFGGFIQARKEDFYSTNVYAIPIIVKAFSKEEAIGKAIKLCKERFPSTGNWYNHTADVVGENGE